MHGFRWLCPGDCTSSGQLLHIRAFAAYSSQCCDGQSPCSFYLVPCLIAGHTASSFQAVDGVTSPGATRDQGLVRALAQQSRCIQVTVVVAVHEFPRVSLPLKSMQLCFVPAAERCRYTCTGCAAHLSRGSCRHSADDQDGLARTCSSLQFVWFAWMCLLS